MYTLAAHAHWASEGAMLAIAKLLGAPRVPAPNDAKSFAIPHFFYHVTTAYVILRNQGVKLTMGDFLGNWGAS